MFHDSWQRILPDEPGHPRADQLYLLFNLGPVAELPRPIPSARGRRILFIPTNWQRIAAAEDVNEPPKEPVAVALTFSLPLDVKVPPKDAVAIAATREKVTYSA